MNILPIHSAYPTVSDIETVRERLTKQQLDDIRTKVSSVSGSIIFGDYKDRLLAERMLEYGMILAHVELRNDTPIEIITDTASIDGLTIERYASYFEPKLIEYTKAHVCKPLRSYAYHEALSRELNAKHYPVGDMFAKCAVILDAAVPVGEVRFYMDKEVVYVVKGVQQ